MHYNVRAFAVEQNKPTIRVKNPDKVTIRISKIGKIPELSSKDIEWANKKYCKSEFAVKMGCTIILNVASSYVHRWLEDEPPF